MPPPQGARTVSGDVDLALLTARTDLGLAFGQVLTHVLDWHETDNLTDASGAGAVGNLVVGEQYPLTVVGLGIAAHVSTVDGRPIVLADRGAPNLDQ
jgi:hypothetical protein